MIESRGGYQIVDLLEYSTIDNLTIPGIYECAKNGQNKPIVLYNLVYDGVVMPPIYPQSVIINSDSVSIEYPYYDINKIIIATINNNDNVAITERDIGGDVPDTRLETVIPEQTFTPTYEGEECFLENVYSYWDSYPDSMTVIFDGTTYVCPKHHDDESSSYAYGATRAYDEEIGYVYDWSNFPFYIYRGIVVVEGTGAHTISATAEVENAIFLYGRVGKCDVKDYKFAYVGGSGTKDITQNGTTDVDGYQEVNVSVQYQYSHKVTITNSNDSTSFCEALYLPPLGSNDPNDNTRSIMINAGESKEIGIHIMGDSLGYAMVLACPDNKALTVTSTLSVVSTLVKTQYGLKIYTLWIPQTNLQNIDLSVAVS